MLFDAITSSQDNSGKVLKLFIKVRTTNSVLTRKLMCLVIHDFTLTFIFNAKDEVE